MLILRDYPKFHDFWSRPPTTSNNHWITRWPFSIRFHSLWTYPGLRKVTFGAEAGPMIHPDRLNCSGHCRWRNLNLYLYLCKSYLYIYTYIYICIRLYYIFYICMYMCVCCRVFSCLPSTQTWQSTHDVWTSPFEGWQAGPLGAHVTAGWRNSRFVGANGLSHSQESKFQIASYHIPKIVDEYHELPPNHIFIYGWWSISSTFYVINIHHL